MDQQRRQETRHNIAHTGLLLLAAFVWGMAFPFQRMGAGYVGGWTFLAARSWLSVLVMLPVVLIQKHRVKNSLVPKDLNSEDPGSKNLNPANPRLKNLNREVQKTENKARKSDNRKKWQAGILCGIFLCLASGLQQLGIAGTSTAKSGFITAMYVVLVPVLSWIFLKRRQPWKIWICIVLCVSGLYLLCFPGGSGGFSTGDLLTLGCAFMFAGQIILVDRYVGEVGALRLTFEQFVTESILATILMLLFEEPTLSGLRQAAIPILYAGIMSSAVGYSLQAVGQKDLNPAIASLAMCMESVFSAIGGWFLLHESLTSMEAAGCALMFAAIVLTELPVENLVRPRAAQ